MVLVALAMVLPASATAAGEVRQTGTRLPLKHFRALAVDSTHHLAFVSGLTDDVVVVDASGSVVRTLDGLPGADGLALSRDDSTLFVSASRGYAIVAIDTTTFARTTYPVGAHVCPRNTALAAGLLWFISNCNNETDDDFGVSTLKTLNLQNGQVLSRTGPQLDDDMQLIQAPGPESNRLYANASGQLQEIGVADGGDDLSFTSVTRLDDIELSEAAFTPDGERVVLAGGNVGRWHASVYDVDGYRPVDSYPAADIPSAVTVGDDGRVAVGIDRAMRTGFPFNLWVYPPGRTSFPNRYELTSGVEDEPTGIPRGGLRFDGSRLFAVTVNDRDTGVNITVFNDPPVPTSPPIGTRHLPFQFLDDVVADPEHGHYFATGGTQTNGIAVLDGRGRLTRILQHTPGAAGMFLDSAHDRLYVALSDTDAIAVVNTRTLGVQKMTLGPGGCPQSIAGAQGLLWVTRTCSPSGARLVAVDPTTGRTYQAGDVVSNRLYSSPVHPSTLFGTSASGNGSAETYHVTGARSGTVPTIRMTHLRPLGEETRDLAISPDGLNVVVSTPGSTFHDVLSARTLKRTGAINTRVQATAVAARADGLIAAGGGFYDGLDPVQFPTARYDVALRRTATGSSSGGVQFDRAHRYTVAGSGLVFGTRSLFSVHRAADGFATLVSPMPAVRPVALGSDYATYRSGQHATVVAHLSRNLDGVAARHRPIVAVYARARGARHARLVRRVRADGFGNVAVHYTMRHKTLFKVVVHDHGRVFRSSLIRSIA